MITKQQYEDAKQLMQDYETQVTKAAIPNLKCICCHKPIVPALDYLPAPTKLEDGCWQEGAVALVTFGYGSRMHDSASYYIALCDTCMQQALEQGIAFDYNVLSAAVR